MGFDLDLEFLNGGSTPATASWSVAESGRAVVAPITQGCSIALANKWARSLTVGASSWALEGEVEVLKPGQDHAEPVSPCRRAFQQPTSAGCRPPRPHPFSEGGSGGSSRSVSPPQNQSVGDLLHGSCLRLGEVRY